MYSVSNKDTTVLTGMLGKIGKNNILDVSLSEINVRDYTVPIHYFVKMWKRKDILCCATLESDYLEDLASKNEIDVSFLKRGDEILLTAQPKEMQQFLLRIADDEKAFVEGLKFICVSQNK